MKNKKMYLCLSKITIALTLANHWSYSRFNIHTLLVIILTSYRTWAMFTFTLFYTQVWPLPSLWTRMDFSTEEGCTVIIILSIIVFKYSEGFVLFLSSSFVINVLLLLKCILKIISKDLEIQKDFKNIINTILKYRILHCCFVFSQCAAPPQTWIFLNHQIQHNYDWKQGHCNIFIYKLYKLSIVIVLLYMWIGFANRNEI